jgi:hypothetical protein
MVQESRDAWCSCLAAIFFGIHPLHVESGARITETQRRTDFFLVDGLPGLRLVFVSAAMAPLPDCSGHFGAGLLAKPMLVTLPFVLLLLDFSPLGRILCLGGERARNPDAVNSRPTFST